MQNTKHSGMNRQVFSMKQVLEFRLNRNFLLLSLKKCYVLTFVLIYNIFNSIYNNDTKSQQFWRKRRLVFFENIFHTYRFNSYKNYKLFSFIMLKKLITLLTGCKDDVRLIQLRDASCHKYQSQCSIKVNQLDLCFLFVEFCGTL